MAAGTFAQLMNTLRVVQIVGARPQFIKLAPVSRAFALQREATITELIVHTGQHYDPQLSDVFFEELSIPHAAANLEVGSGSHAHQTAAMLERIEAYLLANRPNVVVVYGDTNSTLAGALSAAKLHIPVAHVEAGLRSFNRRMPEELNRVATDHLSDLLLAPTAAAVKNLTAEGLAARARQVGDVMYDALMTNMVTSSQRSRILEQLKLAGPFGLVTIHRAESTTPAAFHELLELLRSVSSLVPLIFPVHPRTRAILQASQSSYCPPAGLRLIDPLGPLDMLRITQASQVVITDSGGLQKEAFMLGRPCVTLRSETEWVETLECGDNVLVGRDSVAALAAVRAALQRRQSSAQRAAALYGAGGAAHRCVSAILELARA
jgi:UDP-GlcNAc3NAcA epimerase